MRLLLRYPFSGIVRTLSAIARFLLMITAVSLITMPITQHLWTWDRFLRGGYDFEFGLLTILLAMCLFLLLARHFQNGILEFLDRLRLLAASGPGFSSASLAHRHACFMPRLHSHFNPVLTSGSLPLLI